MTAAQTIGAYTDCQNVFDRALAAERGIRIPFASKGDAVCQRNRLNHFRSMHRKLSKEILPKDHPEFGMSCYDPYMVSLREDTEGFWWIYIIPRIDNFGEAEEITDANAP